MEEQGMRETLKNSAGANRGGQNRIGRRAVLGGMAATGLLALPACSTMQGYGLTEAIRRLLLLSSQRAFAQLTAPGGFYDNALNRLELPGQFRSSGHKLADFLASAVFKSRLQKAFNAMAEEGAERAAPLVADAVRGVSIADAAALIRGGPTGATQFLHQVMGTTLIEAMVPALGDALRVAQDPLVGQALSSLAGVDDVGGVARGFAGQVDDKIWGAIGREEAAIRADPAATRDPVLIGVFGKL
jgi:hypothetical protein